MESVKMADLKYEINIQAKIIKDMTMMLGSIDAECFEDFEGTSKEMLGIMQVMINRIIETTNEGSEIE